MPKSIIGAGFSDFVQKQIELRQKKNKIANKNADTIFYQNANTAFLRLSSGVDVGENDPSRAKKYQLYNLRFDGQPATGYGLGGNTAYGWESNSGYGFVPPPGLISADIKAMNRGSLREANINLLCHSMDQFEIIDQLYLRLGYSMLLEWGWSWYFNNDEKLGPSYHNVATDQFFFNNSTNYVNLLNQIQNDRDKSCGNYDAMLGRIVNYSWNLERDGSYNITLTMRSVGDVIESIKTNTNLNTSTDTVNNEGPALNVNSNKSTLNRILYELSKKVPSDKGSVRSLDGVTTGYIEGLLKDVKSSNTKGDDPNSVKDVLKVNYINLKPENANGATYNQFYIKLGKLIDIIQNFLLYYSPKQDNQAIINFSSDRNENFCFTFPAHGSLDPRVCLIPVNAKLENPIVDTQDPNAPTGVTHNYLIKEYQYTWYEVSWRFGNRSTGEYNSKIWDPTNPSSIIPSEVQNKLSSFQPGSVIVINGPVDAGGSQTKTVNRLSDKALAFLKSTPNGEDLKDDYADKWTYSTFNGDTSYPLDAELNKEYLIKNGITNVSSTGSSAVFVDSVDIVDQRLSQQNGEEYRTTYYIYKHTAVTHTYFNPNELVPSTPASDEAPPSDKVTTEYIKGTGFRVDDKYVGSTMDIYVNMDYIVTTLANYIDVNTNTISAFDFLEKLMLGIQNALGCINNFTTVYDEDSNVFRIIDSTFIPNLDKLESVKQYFAKPPVEFITHTLDTNQGSFVRDAIVKTKLSNNFATMVTVGAQANGNVVGENATALSKWNVGLYDRIIKEKLDTISVNNPNSRDNSQTLLLQNFTTLGGLFSAIDDRSVTTDLIDSSRNSSVDLFKYYIGTLDIPGIGFLPIDLELTMDGLSGIKIYESYTADTRLLSKRYKDKIQFITTGVSHKIQNNDWTTTLTSISGPKYTGVEIKDPKELPIVFAPLRGGKGSQGDPTTVQGNLKTWGSSYATGVLNDAQFNKFTKPATQKEQNTALLTKIKNQLGAQKTTPYTSTSPYLEYNVNTGFTLGQVAYLRWIEAFLLKAGLPRTYENKWFCIQWATAENTAAKNNLFATTWKAVGATDYNDNNGYPVKNYQSLEDGANWNAATIKQQQYYPALYEALSKGNLTPLQIWQYKMK
jgi:hypothetical protein